MKSFRALMILAAGVLCFGIFASQFGARWPLADSLAHFRAHLLAVLALVLVMMAAARLWRWSLAVAVAFVAGLASLSPALPFTAGGDDRPSLKLVQYNSLFRNPRVDVSVDWIRAQKPDFVTLQEVSSRTVAIYDGLAGELPHGVLCQFAGVGGVAVRSRFPLRASDCMAGDGFAWVQADVNGKPLSIASLHLHWPHPFGQWPQLYKLSGAFKAVPRPVLLAGDFNAAPWSAAVAKVAHDTQTHVAPGLRLTLKMGTAGLPPVPFLPIDHVLLPRTAHLQGISSGPSIGSDHLPVIARFSLD